MFSRCINMSAFCVVLNLIFFSYSVHCKSLPVESTDVHTLILSEGEVFRQQMHRIKLVYFNYLTNLTNENIQKKIEAEIVFDNAEKKVLSNIKKICNTTTEEPLCEYNFSELELLPEEELKELETAIADMEEYYITGYLRENSTNSTDSKDLVGDSLTDTSSGEDDENEIYSAQEMVELWENGLTKVGPNIRDSFRTYVRLSNKAARLNNFTSYAEDWIDDYDDPDFEQNIDAAVEAIMPLYRELHGYIRHCLKKYYTDDYLKEAGDMPAHILDWYFASSWDEAHDLCMPYYTKTKNSDIDRILKNKAYSGREMTKIADEFYQSMGMQKLPESFWKRSIFEKRNNTPMDCIPMAYDMFEDTDVRISMCPESNLNDILTIVHELGHIQNYLSYQKQFPLLRQGANPGFEEAVGDTITISFKNAKHLNRIGLLKDSDISNETSINLMYSMAMDKIAYIPFAYSLDKYRYAIFRGEINESSWNTEYWRMRSAYSGISPPVPRDETDFDPPNIEHFRTDTEVMRYVAAHLFQFQFHKALCKIAGQYDSNDEEKTLDKCDLYGNKAAGKAFSKFLSLGSSVDWQDALEEFTGERTMNASAILEYFEPLYDWLREYNRENNVYIGWPTEGDM